MGLQTRVKQPAPADPEYVPAMQGLHAWDPAKSIRARAGGMCRLELRLYSPLYPTLLSFSRSDQLKLCGQPSHYDAKMQMVLDIIYQ
jgi:hypothetical protein